MIAVFTDTQLIWCGVASAAAALSYGLRNSGFRIPLQLPSPPSLPSLAFASEALTRISLGKRKRSSSHVSNASASTLESDRDRIASDSEENEDIVADEAQSSSPIPARDDDDTYEDASRRKRQRISAEREGIEELATISMDVDVPSQELEPTQDIIQVDEPSKDLVPAQETAEPPVLNPDSFDVPIATEVAEVVTPASDTSEALLEAGANIPDDSSSGARVPPANASTAITTASSPRRASADFHHTSSFPAATSSTSTKWASTPTWASRSASTIPPAFPSGPLRHPDAFSAFASTQSTVGFKCARNTDDSALPAWMDTSSPATRTSIDDSSEPEKPLAMQVHKPSSHNCITGEEDEDVEADLKGVRLLVKRGSKDFVDCGRGHIKLLESKEPASERLVFRREQVLKLAMNVRLRSTVRCTFSEEENVLRVILKEPSDVGSEELVVYALKVGKASKKEFADFAALVAGSPHLKAA